MNWGLLDEDELNKRKLPPNLNCIYDKHLDDVKLKFPARMRNFLQLSPMTYHRVAGDIVEAQWLILRR